MPHLRHPDIGFVFKSCIVSPHSPIDANIHATINRLVIINSLSGTRRIVNIAVCKEKYIKYIVQLNLLFVILNTTIFGHVIVHAQ